MVSQHQNEKDQSTFPNWKPRTLRLSYAPSLANKITSALDFVLDKLKFQPVERFIFNEAFVNKSVTLKDLNGNSLTLDLQIIDNKPEMKNITFYTDDCLRDYHKYLIAGVEFMNRPEYTHAGLQVDFIGNSDNRYTLLEERIYTET